MNIFIDLDGTLVDSRRRLYKLFCDLSGSQKLPFHLYWKYKRVARSNEWILAQILGFDTLRIQAFVRGWLEQIESPEYLALDAPFGFARSVLKDLSSAHALFVLTARRDEHAARAQVDGAGFTPYLTDMLVTGPRRSKIELLSARRGQAHPEDLVVGDTELDVQVAEAIGAQSVAVLSGFRCRQHLELFKPDFMYVDLGAFRADFFMASPLSKR
jgi:phosphoglycolate phosphatase